MTKLLKRVAIVSQTGDRTVTYQICSSSQQTHHIKKKKKTLVNMIIPSFYPADGTATTPIQHQKWCLNFRKKEKEVLNSSSRCSYSTVSPILLERTEWQLIAHGLDNLFIARWINLSQSTEFLADLPQFQGHLVISGMSGHFLCLTAGEVLPAQRFDSFLQGTVQCGLSSHLWVQEQQPGHRLDENLLPQADISRQFSPDNTYRAEGKEQSHTYCL